MHNKIGQATAENVGMGGWVGDMGVGGGAGPCLLRMCAAQARSSKPARVEGKKRTGGSRQQRTGSSGCGGCGSRAWGCAAAAASARPQSRAAESAQPAPSAPCGPAPTSCPAQSQCRDPPAWAAVQERVGQGSASRGSVRWVAPALAVAASAVTPAMQPLRCSRSALPLDYL